MYLKPEEILSRHKKAFAAKENWRSIYRSEERRVGKECRSRWAREH